MRGRWAFAELTDVFDIEAGLKRVIDLHSLVSAH